MGASCAKDTQEDVASKEIEKELRETNKRYQSEKRLLLLGAGDSGKSTICKQLLILNHLFKEDERKSYIYYIHLLTIDCMRMLLTLCFSSLPPEGVKDSDLLHSLRSNVQDESRPLQPEIGEVIARLWSYPIIQEEYKKSNGLYIPDCTSYLMDNVLRFAKLDFIPTNQDCLRLRKRTLGIVEHEFEYAKTKFRIIDAGGQRSERKKWLNVFEEVITAVLYCVALNEYDMHLAEAKGVNRMMEALILFQDVMATSILRNLPIIMFFNKRDLLLRKLNEGYTPSIIFDDYTGGTDFDKAVDFIQHKFLANAPVKKNVYPHVSCALDVENVRFIWESIQDIVLWKAIDDKGLQF